MKQEFSFISLSDLNRKIILFGEARLDVAQVVKARKEATLIGHNGNVHKGPRVTLNIDLIESKD